jgi:hypothetical protein
MSAGKPTALANVSQNFGSSAPSATNRSSFVW